MDEVLRMADVFKSGMEKLLSGPAAQVDVERLQAGILAMAGRRCPCGHPLDRDGDPDTFGCLNGRIYGPCGDENCDGQCDDTAGRCKGLDGCCDPENQQTSMIGQRLAASDPEPPVGSVVVDDCGITWENDGFRPACWVRPDLREEGVHDPETWRKIAGNYGPVTVQQWGQA